MQMVVINQLLVLVMVMTVVVVECENPRLDIEVLYQDHFPPLHTNCTQSMTDLLLLRQEVKLTEVTKILTEIRDALTTTSTIHVPRPPPTDNGTCTSPMRRVGERCLLLALWERLSWMDARQYCAGLGGDLAVLTDANNLADTLHYINEINSERTEVSVWLGGTDQTVEGVWLWVTGDPMPRGPPFWGYVDNYRSEPSGGKNQNCAVLYHQDYYIHDTECSGTFAPLCQL
ncbi:perlucin-like protein [Panulirus ornatus]|uniref:perlucin-like protein n=1 Tax=Panulirus ornatus TaxID=150431 RepID=UPI003A8865A2